jgi:hypothetical protein
MPLTLAVTGTLAQLQQRPGVQLLEGMGAGGQESVGNPFASAE